MTVLSDFDPNTFLEIVIGWYIAIEVSVMVLIPMWSKQIKTSMTRLLEPSRQKFISWTSPCLLLTAAVVDTLWLTRIEEPVLRASGAKISMT